jgi:aspartyl aminopeptidase
MHSIREICAVDDVYHAIHLFCIFFNEFIQMDTKFHMD